MATTRIFDRDTLLDLLVNFVPLFILLFFAVGFLVWQPFGYDVFPILIHEGLIAVPFIVLAVLTYLSAKAIAGDEKRAEEVYPPGQATVTGVDPIEKHDE